MTDPAAHEAWFLHAFLWAAFVVACGIASLPLCTRAFRALPDRGGFAAAPVGLLLSTWFAWLFSLHAPAGGTGANRVRALCLLAAAAACVPAWLATRGRTTSLRRRLAAWWAPSLLGALGIVHLRHGALAAWLSLLCVAACSLAVLADKDWRKRVVRQAMPSFVLAQSLFLAGFVFFAIVRSFLPWAHWDPSYSAAEKFGNLMHLNSIMHSDAMPPGDAWMFGLPTNYYYGGHLVVATIAKATGTSGGVAFNLGLATIVGLTLSGGFGLSANLFGARPRLRLCSIATVAAGTAGCIAITFFGNVDGLAQILERGLHRTTFEHYDFWRSSRVIFSASPGAAGAGTITEFPWFSAILGDLHPHHMALPFSLVLLASFLQLCRASSRGVRTGEAWTRRCLLPAFVAAALLGFIFCINIWDAVVFGPMLLPVVALSMKGTSWQGVPLAAARRLATVALVALVFAFLCNAAPNAVPMFGVPLGLVVALAALGVFWASPMSPELRRPLLWTVPAACGALVFAGGWSAVFQHAKAIGGETTVAAAIANGCRDAFAFGVAVLAGTLLCGRSTTMRSWFPALAAWGAAGILALAVSSPFRAFFASPVGSSGPLLVSMLPPMPSSTLIGDGTGILERFWERSPVSPFASQLRTKPGEVLVYWGQFLVPVLLLLSARLASPARTPKASGLVFGLTGIAVGAGAWMFMQLQSMTAPLAAVLGALFLVVACRQRASHDGLPWMLLAGAMAGLLFVETLHFDDSYAGDYERYNTPFKILYPLWPVMGLGMVAAYSAFARWSTARIGVPASVATTALLCLPVLAVGLAYPTASTATRARAFGAYPPHSTLEQNHPRSLDATEWLFHANDPALASDAKIAAWLRGNAEPGALLLEAPAPSDRQSYAYHGRFAAMTGIPGVSGWPHHELQWRGWGTRVPERTAAPFERFMTEAQRTSGFTWLDLAEMARSHADRILEAPSWDAETVDLVRFYGVRYVVVGSLELQLLAENGNALRKFDDLDPAFADGDCAVHRVPDSMLAEESP